MKYLSSLSVIVQLYPDLSLPDLMGEEVSLQGV
jgi:hypothetical protein